jgi:hypothetical protein
MLRRNRRRLRSASTIAAATLAVAAIAGAAAADEGGAGRGPVALELSFGGVGSTAVREQGACITYSCGVDEMLTTGIALQAQVGPLMVGPSVDISTSVFGRTEIAPALRLGLGFGTPRTRLEVFAEGGVRTYDAIGSDIFTTAQGPTPALPFVGGRIGVSHRLGRSGTSLGLWLTARADLRRETVMMLVKDDFLCDDECSGTTKTYAVGGNSFGLLGTVRFEMMRHR